MSLQCVYEEGFAGKKYKMIKDPRSNAKCVSKRIWSPCNSMTCTIAQIDSCTRKPVGNTIQLCDNAQTQCKSLVAIMSTYNKKRRTAKPPNVISISRFSLLQDGSRRCTITVSDVPIPFTINGSPGQGNATVKNALTPDHTDAQKAVMVANWLRIIPREAFLTIVRCARGYGIIAVPESKVLGEGSYEGAKLSNGTTYVTFIYAMANVALGYMTASLLPEWVRVQSQEPITSDVGKLNPQADMAEYHNIFCACARKGTLSELQRVSPGRYELWVQVLNGFNESIPAV